VAKDVEEVVEEQPTEIPTEIPKEIPKGVAQKVPKVIGPVSTTFATFLHSIAFLTTRPCAGHKTNTIHTMSVPNQPTIMPIDS
jgi:hypothetical protein